MPEALGWRTSFAGTEDLEEDETGGRLILEAADETEEDEGTEAAEETEET